MNNLYARFKIETTGQYFIKPYSTGTYVLIATKKGEIMQMMPVAWLSVSYKVIR